MGQSQRAANWKGMVAVALGMLAMVFLGVLVFGRVEGMEFSPQRFRMRRFYYYHLPIVRLQVYPIEFESVASDLAKHVRANRLVGTVRNEPVRWDIATMREVGRSYEGDALLLVRYLEQPGAKGVESWLSWTENHPERAAQLWPLVARLAQENMYVLIPDLLQSARDTIVSNPSAADAESGDGLRRFAVEDLKRFSRAESERGNGTRAAELLRCAEEIARAKEDPQPAGSQREDV